MKKFFLVFLTLFNACDGHKKDQELGKEIILEGKTFVLHPENNSGDLTVHFMDSTCHLFEANDYNRPWRLVTFENSNTLVLGRLFISLNKKNDSILSGINIGESDTKLVLQEKRPKWSLENILGKWTEAFWIGVDKSNLPPPPPRISESEIYAPPYYDISKNQIKHYFFGVDSAKVFLDSSLEHMIVKSLSDDRLGYQKKWRILNVTDSTMTVERKFSKHDPDSYSYFDGIDTLKLVKKR